jgi:hypothetical protein
MLSAVESSATQRLRLTLTRQLAEVLLRGVSGIVYSCPEKAVDSTGQFGYFVLTTEVVICNDINVNFLVENRKTCLNSLLLSYNLPSIVNFPTRNQNNSLSAIDNILINISKLETYILMPHSNSLSENEAQLLEILYIDLEPENQQQQLISKIDNNSVADFVMKLSY